MVRFVEGIQSGMWCPGTKINPVVVLSEQDHCKANVSEPGWGQWWVKVKAKLCKPHPPVCGKRVVKREKLQRHVIREQMRKAAASLCEKGLEESML